MGRLREDPAVLIHEAHVRAKKPCRLRNQFIEAGHGGGVKRALLSNETLQSFLALASQFGMNACNNGDERHTARHGKQGDVTVAGSLEHLGRNLIKGNSDAKPHPRYPACCNSANVLRQLIWLPLKSHSSKEDYRPGAHEFARVTQFTGMQDREGVTRIVQNLYPHIGLTS